MEEAEDDNKEEHINLEWVLGNEKILPCWILIQVVKILKNEVLPLIDYLHQKYTMFENDQNIYLKLVKKYIIICSNAYDIAAEKVQTMMIDA